MDLQQTCQNCQKQYSDTNLPRTLTNCGHTYCQACISNMSTNIQNGNIRIVCPQDHTQLILRGDEALPVNKALLGIIQQKKNNSSIRSLKSFQNESFNVPKLNQSYQEDEDTNDLIRAISEDAKIVIQDNDPQSNTKESTPEAINKEIQPQMCLLHNKPIEVICLFDKERLCSKCALFGQHKNHQFAALEQIQRENKKKSSKVEQILEEKYKILKSKESKSTESSLLQILQAKQKKFHHEIQKQFKKIMEQIMKVEKDAHNKLEESTLSLKKTIKNVLLLDQHLFNDFEIWQEITLKKLKQIQSKNHENTIQFYMKGDETISEGADIIYLLKSIEEKQFNEAVRIIDDLDIHFNLEKTINSIRSIFYINQRSKFDELLQKSFNFQDRQSFDIESINNIDNFKRCIKTQARDDDQQSLLDLGQDFQQKFNNSVIEHHTVTSTNFLATSRMNKKSDQKKNTMSKLIKTPVKLTMPRKKVPTSKQTKEQKNRELIMPIVPLNREAIKKKIKSIKVPEKFEKLLEGIINDTVQTADFTNGQLGDAIILQICQLAKHNIKLRTLKLIRNKITDDGFNKILGVLGSINTLNISQNSLSDNCLAMIQMHKNSIPSLKSIILSQNKINQRKCKPLIEKLKKMDLAISI